MAANVGIAWGYYHELFTGHPGLVRISFTEFAVSFASLPWYSAEMRELEALAVPDPADRVDFERLDRPLTGLTFATAGEFQEYLRSYIEADVTRRSDPRHSADLGAFLALLSVYIQLPRLMPFDGWWAERRPGKGDPAHAGRPARRLRCSAPGVAPGARRSGSA